jgi:VWFA-related protein
MQAANARRLGGAAAIAAVAAACAAALGAQSFRTRVDVVQVTVTVIDANGRFVPGLSRDAFALWEDGVEQPITEFTALRVPVSVGILLDASDSMRGQAIVDAREALDQFVGERLNEEDEAFVATFNHLPRLASLWKRPPSALKNVLAGLQPSGGTAIWDALAESSRVFERRAHTRAAFVVVSDGGDTASDRTLLQALDAVRESDALVYAVAIDAPDARASARVNPDGLREITGLTGGYTEVVHSAADLGGATTRIADELNAQYTIGYSSSRPPDGSWRSIRVRAGEYRTRYRRGYFAVQPGARR